jgi:hypothetical protein
MARRKNLVIGLIALLMIGLFVFGRYEFVRMTRPRHPLEIACEKILEGMSTEEAIAIVGRAPDDSPVSSPGGSMDFAVWYDDGHESYLEVVCSDGRITLKHFISNREEPETLMHRLRRWLIRVGVI